MNRIQRIVVTSPLVTALLGGAIFGLGRAGSSAVGCGEEQVVGVAGLSSALAEGRGTAAVSGNKVVVLEGFGNRSAYTPIDAGTGVLRHAANAPGAGTAFVNDKKGSDTVITVGSRGLSAIAASGEASHPTFSTSGHLVWAEDFQTLKVASQEGSVLKTIGRPEGSTAIFSPLFVGSDTLIAVLQEPVEADTGEDDSLNNLYRYDMSSDTWARLTAFQGTFEDWSVLRTPVLGPDASVFFVRVRGAASQTVQPLFELWSLRGEAVSKVRDLPSEMYLAGTTDQGLLWNIFDGTEWRLFSESQTGLRDLGCGAVMVDPRSQPDPDIPVEDPAVRGSRRTTAGIEAAASLAIGEMAILVGDFSSRQGAEAVALRLGVPGLEIVTHRIAPLAVAPGKWAVARRVPVDADLTAALEDFRRQFPEYSERSWVVSLAGGTSMG
jgi:hypothetical protein